MPVVNIKLIERIELMLRAPRVNFIHADTANIILKKSSEGQYRIERSLILLKKVMELHNKIPEIENLLINRILPPRITDDRKRIRDNTIKRIGAEAKIHLKNLRDLIKQRDL